MSLIKRLSSEGDNKIKKFGKKTLVSFLSAGLIFINSCGGGNGVNNSDNGNTNSPADEPIIEGPFDYKTTVTTVNSEYIEPNKGGVLDTYNLGTLVDGRKLTIPADALYQDEIISIGQVDNPPILPIEKGYVGAYVVTPIDLSPNGTAFSEPVTIEIPYTDEELSDAGIDDESKLIFGSYNPSDNSLEEIPVESIDLENNIVTGKTTHFSYYVLLDKIKIPEERDLGIPKPGDLLYKTGMLGVKITNEPIDPSKMWMPGHVGVNTGEKDYLEECFDSTESKCLASEEVKIFGKYNVIEALKHGVQYSYYDLPNVTETYEYQLPKFEGSDVYMGAREPKTGALTEQQRKNIVEFVEAQIGKPYVWAQTFGVNYGLLAGHLVKGPDRFNCVGLVEAAYEHAGINNGIGLTTPWQEDGEILNIKPVLTPKEQYNQTRPAGFEEPAPEPGSIPTQLPNLKITDVIARYYISSGYYMATTKVTVRNDGEADSGPYSLEGTLVPSCGTPSRAIGSSDPVGLMPGEEKQYTIKSNYIRSCGQTWNAITLEDLKVDPKNEVIESDEEDNTFEDVVLDI